MTYVDVHACVRVQHTCPPTTAPKAKKAKKRKAAEEEGSEDDGAAKKKKKKKVGAPTSFSAIPACANKHAYHTYTRAPTEEGRG